MAKVEAQGRRIDEFQYGQIQGTLNSLKENKENGDEELENRSKRYKSRKLGDYLKTSDLSLAFMIQLVRKG